MTCRGIAIECCGGCCGGAVGVVMMPPMRLVLPRADLLTANTEKNPAVLCIGNTCKKIRRYLFLRFPV